MSPQERKLRSKDQYRKHNSTLFTFENINKLLYRDQCIKVKRKGLKAELESGSGLPSCSSLPTYLSKSLSEGTNTTSDTSQTSIAPSNGKVGGGALLSIQIKDNVLLPRRTDALVDTLGDSLYTTFHKKMKKEEKKMSNIDRTRIFNEVDTLTTLLLLLQQYDWVKHIQGITHISNPHDFKELEYKRLLTMMEILKILQKYESWKKREDELSSETKEFHRNLEFLSLPNGADGGSIESEFHMTIADLQKKRKSERCKKYGQIVRLILSNGYELIVDPCLSPKLIKQEFIKVSSDTAVDGASITRGPLKALDGSLTRISGPVNKKTKLQIKLPDMEQQDYKIYPNWRNHYREWEPERKKQRELIRNRKS